MAREHEGLAGKVALITGGASGIGRAIGEELAARGCEVVLADRQQSLAEEVAKGIATRGGRATPVALDVRSMAAFQAVADGILARSGHIDLLFNNAGIGVGGEMDNYAPEDWDDVIDVNLRGVTNGIQAVYPAMVKQRSGHIINTASMAGLISTPTEGSYTATKHAVVGLSKALRIEARRHGVRVSVLCPGAIKTPILTGGAYGRLNVEGLSKEYMEKMWERMKPMPPAVFARKAVDAVLDDEAIIILPSWWRALWWVERASPALSSWLGSLFVKQFRKDLEAAGARPMSRDKQ